jgi:hypothetical protein
VLGFVGDQQQTSNGTHLRDKWCEIVRHGASVGASEALQTSNGTCEGKCNERKRRRAESLQY